MAALIRTAPVACRRVSVFFVFVLFFAASFASAQQAPAATQERAEIVAEKYEYSVDGQVMTGTGGVKATYQDITVLADKIVYNVQTHDFTATGNVRLKQLKNTWRAEMVKGNIKAKVFDFGKYESTFEPWYVKGEEVTRAADGTTHFHTGEASTCEHLLSAGAHWRMSAKRIEYGDDGRFTAYDVTYKLGSFPVFYTPVAWGQTDWERGGFEFSPGYNSDFGAMLRIGKKWEINEAATTRFRLHLMSKRGIALENDTEIKTERSKTEFHGFGLADSEPPSDTEIGGEEFNGRFEVEDDRYRLAVEHRTDLSDRLTLRLQTNYLSDNDLMWEFYEDEFRTNPEAPTFVDLTYAGDRFEASINMRPSINDFESVVERLPEIRLDVMRQQIAGSPLYYEGHNSLSKLRMNWREYDADRVGAGLTDPDNYESNRADTLHLLYAPFTLWDISFVPRAAARWTFYSDTSLTPVTDAELNSTFKADDIRGVVTDTNPSFSYDDLGGDQGRFAWEVGMEVSTKFYRTDPTFKSDFLQADGFRHIVKPYVNYTYLPEPTLEREEIYYFDEVDRLQQTHFVRVGIDNRFQTRRGRRIHTFARMENYIDFNVNSDEDDGDTESADFGTVLELSPTENWRTWVKLLYDTDEGELSALNVGFRLGATNEPNLSIAYLFRDDFVQNEPYSMGSDFTRIVDSSVFPSAYEKNHNVRLTLNVPINDRTKFQASQYYDLEDDELARQRYEIIRDLHCWVGALSLDKDRDDFTIMLSFYLKAFPKTRVGAGL
jgi:lipopolysaccharide assembly outer membrane protein LptD (OstA)